MSGKHIIVIALLSATVSTAGVLSGCAKSEPARAPAGPTSTVDTFARAEVAEVDQAMGGETREKLHFKAADRMVIHEAFIRLRAEDPVAAMNAVEQLAMSSGGYIVNAETWTNGETVTQSEIVVRVPSADYDQTMIDLRELGTPLSERKTGQDVTEEYVDVSARIRTKRQLEERFLVLLTQSENIEDSLRVEQELARVRSEIERMEGRAKYLEKRSAMATITVTALAPDQPGAEGAESVASRLGNAWDTAASVSIDVMAGLIVFAGAVLPVLLVLGFMVGGIVAVIALARRRRRVAS